MTLSRSLLCGSALAVLLAAPARAQPGAADPPTAVDAEVEAVVVTGSRITRKDYVAESPIVTLDQAAIRNTGTPALEETLNQLPQFTPSSGAQSFVGGTGPPQRAGRANINLRGLGPSRTLVLLDGRRMQPSDPFGAVDMNAIPRGLIETIEVVTGGASAAYGSDAVAGVVNVRLNRRFTGLRLDGEYGASHRGDAKIADLAGAWGRGFAGGRGHALVAASWFDRGAVLRRDLPFMDETGGSAQANIYVPDGNNLIPQPALTALFRSYGETRFPTPSSTLSVNPDGTVYSNREGLNLRYPPASGFFVSPLTGGVEFRDRENEPNTTVQPMTRYGGFAHLAYDLGERFRAYAQLDISDFVVTHASQGIVQGASNPITVPISNPFVSPDFRALLQARPKPGEPFTFYFTPRRVNAAKYAQNYTVGQGVLGLEGRFPVRDWVWDAYALFGRTEEVDDYTGFVSRQGFLDLVNAPDGGAGLCAGGYPLFGEIPLSEACRAFLARPVTNRWSFEQDIAEATLQGGLFDLPAGELRFAVGAGVRRNAYSFDPDRQLVEKTVLSTSGQSPAGGETSVAEVFGELLIPLLRGRPLAHELNLDLAYRYSDYDTVGGVHAYKAAVDWRLLRSLRLRGGYQRAIRAPSAGELYAAEREIRATLGSTLSGGGDPCDNRSRYRRSADADRVRSLCLATGVPVGVVDSLQFTGTSLAAFAIGNAALREETADSVTAGLVWRSPAASPWLAGLSASVDWFSIDLAQAIGSVTSAVSLQRCFNGDGLSNPGFDPENFYCRNITRNSSGQLSFINEPSQNLAGYRTSGVDLQLDWAADLGPGRVKLNLVLSYLAAYEIQTLSGAPFLDYAGTIGNAQIDPSGISHPRWRAVTNLGYALGAAELNLRWRYVDGMKHAANVGAAEALSKGVHPTSYFDLVGRWAPRPGLELRVGAVNLFDQPPPHWTGDSATDPSLYDLIGRRFFVSLSRTWR